MQASTRSRNSGPTQGSSGHSGQWRISRLTNSAAVPGRSAWEGRIFPESSLLGITRRASSPRRFLGQEPPGYGERSAHHEGRGHAHWSDVVIDDHLAALRVSHAATPGASTSHAPPVRCGRSHPASARWHWPSTGWRVQVARERDGSMDSAAVWRHRRKTTSRPPFFLFTNAKDSAGSFSVINTSTAITK
jgi:hypothetical protein